MDAWAKLADTILGWVLSEEGMAEQRLRWGVSRKQKEAKRALADRDYSSLRTVLDELERMSVKP